MNQAMKFTEKLVRLCRIAFRVLFRVLKAISIFRVGIKLGLTNTFLGRSILESTASQLDVKPTVSTTYSQTRFASSAFVQWQRLVKSYKLFTMALKNATPALSDEQHQLQNQVLGQVRLQYYGT